MQRFNIVKARPDRNNPEKTYWDPIGVLFAKDADGVDLSNVKFFGQIYAIGDINIFPATKKEDNPFE